MHQEERVEKEDSSQEKRASVVLQLTWGVPETPALHPESWVQEINMPIEAKLLKCPACLELIDICLFCDFIATKALASVSLLHLATPQASVQPILMLSQFAQLHCSLFLSFHTRGHKQVAYRLD